MSFDRTIARPIRRLAVGENWMLNVNNTNRNRNGEIAVIAPSPMQEMAAGNVVNNVPSDSRPIVQNASISAPATPIRYYPHRNWQGMTMSPQSNDPNPNQNVLHLRGQSVESSPMSLHRQLGRDHLPGSERKVSELWDSPNNTGMNLTSSSSSVGVHTPPRYYGHGWSLKTNKRRHHQQQSYYYKVNETHLRDDDGNVSSSTNPKKGSKITWNDTLREAPSDDPVFSRKVFLGGLPPGCGEYELWQIFKNLGLVETEWPHSGENRMLGFVYVIFDSVAKVVRLLSKCEPQFKNGKDHDWYLDIGMGRIQVVPWDTKHNHYPMRDHLVTNDKEKKIKPNSVFIGGLHGFASAQYLSLMLTAMFGSVVETSLDVDKYFYPIGFARVTFKENDSYVNALKTGHFLLESADVSRRKLQIEPFLSASKLCSFCEVNSGPFFCRDFACLRYYCIVCFRSYHQLQFLVNNGDIASHRIMFKGKSEVQAVVSDAILSSLILEFSDLYQTNKVSQVDIMTNVDVNIVKATNLLDEILQQDQK